MDDPVGYYEYLKAGKEKKEEEGEVEIYGDTVALLRDVLKDRLKPFLLTRTRDDEVVEGGGGKGGREGYRRWCGAVYRVGQREVLEDAVDTLEIMGGEEGREEEEEEEEKVEKGEEGRMTKKARRQSEE